MIITTERLILRPFDERDRAPFAAIHGDPVTMRFYPSIWDRVRCDAVLDHYLDSQAEGKTELLATQLRETNALIGTIGLTAFSPAARNVIPLHPEIEIGWRLDHRFWGQGLAPEGARACLDYAWTELGLDDVYSMTARANLPSQRVMQKIGMTYLPDQDFEHPNVPLGSPLRHHVLYRIENPRRR